MKHIIYRGKKCRILGTQYGARYGVGKVYTLQYNDRPIEVHERYCTPIGTPKLELVTLNG